MDKPPPPTSLSGPLRTSPGAPGQLSDRLSTAACGPAAPRAAPSQLGNKRWKAVEAIEGKLLQPWAAPGLHDADHTAQVRAMGHAPTTPPPAAATGVATAALAAANSQATRHYPKLGQPKVSLSDSRFFMGNEQRHSLRLRGAGAKTCSACHEALPEGSFATAQLRKGAGRRCKVCVTMRSPPPPAATAPPPSTATPTSTTSSTIAASSTHMPAAPQGKATHHARGQGRPGSLCEVCGTSASALALTSGSSATSSDTIAASAASASTTTTSAAAPATATTNHAATATVPTAPSSGRRARKASAELRRPSTAQEARFSAVVQAYLTSRHPERDLDPPSERAARGNVDIYFAVAAYGLLVGGQVPHCPFAIPDPGDYEPAAHEAAGIPRREWPGMATEHEPSWYASFGVDGPSLRVRSVATEAIGLAVDELRGLRRSPSNHAITVATHACDHVYYIIFKRLRAALLAIISEAEVHAARAWLRRYMRDGELLREGFAITARRILNILVLSGCKDDCVCCGQAAIVTDGAYRCHRVDCVLNEEGYLSSEEEEDYGDSAVGPLTTYDGLRDALGTDAADYGDSD